MRVLRLSTFALAFVCASTLPARAAWGSIHGNNRSSAPARAPGRESGGGEYRGVQSAPAQHREAPPGRIEGHAVEPNRVPQRETRVAPPREEIERDARDRRGWDLDEERQHAYFWSDFSVGLPVLTLPPGYVTVYAGGNPYDYYDGVFYQPGPSGYVVMAAPPGAVVSALPPGADPLALGSAVYYYAGGAFYLQQPQGFMVVAPPLGITVPYLPAGANAVTLNGALYYQYDGAYFLPVMQNGTTAFTVVQP